MNHEPKSLQDAIVYFSNPDNCIDYLAIRRWIDGKAVCPGCGSESVSYNANRRTWKCSSHHAKREFSIKVGTVMEDSPITLDKWLVTMWLMTNCKNGISSYEVARDVRVSQKSAWFMLHRIRLAMQDDREYRLGGDEGGPVEADETFIGGKLKNMHVSKRKRFTKGGHQDDKAIVMGMLERNTRQVRAKVIPNVKREVLQAEILNAVAPGSMIFTDAYKGYAGLEKEFIHATVSHISEYVRGSVHTQGIENFWSLLKRTLNGTYVAVEPFHLDRYLDEQMFRFNNRGTKDNPLTDADRFDLVARKLVGKRLTFAELTGKVDSSEAF